ncbi:MAG: FHA domain-containing protein [Planctomycetes bacterium]|nr:FHA domain-containing protein [Planctomycetota bacterium]
MKAELRIIRGEGVGEAFLLPEKGAFLIGRNTDANLRFNDVCVSGMHCQIERSGNVDMATDVRSRNGTFVNGTRITHRPLTDGDVIVIGETALQYHRLPDTPYPKPDTEVIRVRDAWQKSEASVCDKFQLRGRGLSGILGSPESTPEVQKLKSALDAFYRIVTLTHQESDVRVVLERSLDIALTALDADRGAIVLYGAPGEFSQLEIMRRREAKSAEKMVISQTIVDTCFNEGVSILTSFGTPSQTAHATRSVLMQGIQSVMCVPIEAEKCILGVIYLDSTSVVDRFAKPDLEILAAMASILGTLIEKKMLASRAQAVGHQLDYVLSHVPVGIFVTDLEGRFTIWAEHCERLFGYPTQAVVGRDSLALLLAQPDMAPGLLTAAKGGSFEADLEFRRRDASQFLGNLSLKKFFDTSGNHVGFAGMLIDITDRRNLENQLVQQEKMASLGLLAAGISHDFRNLLAPMYGFAQLASLNPSAKDKLVHATLTHAKHAITITNSLLTYARRRDDVLEVVDVCKVLDNVLDLVASELALCNIKVNKLYTSAPGVQVNAGLVQNVFLNLLLNAREAMPQGGTLTLSVEATERDVSLRFVDTGVGIKQEHLRNLFQPFFTTKEGAGGGKKGTGLGLYNSFNIIRSQGGALTCESEEGKGTTFTIKLGIHSEERPSQPLAPTPPPAAGRAAAPARLPVLVLEEGTAMVDLWTTLLDGMDRVITSRGDEALSHCRDTSFAVIFVDVAHAGLGEGFKTLAAIRDLKPGAHLVLVIGNALSEPDEAKATEYADEILQKPFEVARVQQILMAARAAAALDGPNGAAANPGETAAGNAPAAAGGAGR